MKYRIAIYMRLSKEDNKRKEESNSIAVQRMLLKTFVKERFSDYELIEFSDDGFTGTNFNRPGVQQMLAMVKHSALDCIIVKDFSRFARDYIELGCYLEQIFPFMGVRFISVNDHYDSMRDKEALSGLDVNFRNLLYDLYSKDLSQKVRTSLAARKEMGEYVSSHCPFGYEKAPDDRHMLLIAEDEAEIVRRIFSLAEAGYTSIQIAKQLNEEKVKAPIEFKIEKGRTTKTPKGDGFVWSSSFLCQLLRNPVYAGDIVYGKYEKDAVGGQNHLKPRREWKVHYHHHEPIIDRDRFEALQIGRGKVKVSSNQKSHFLVGMVVCGCCGRNLRYRPTQNPYFYCQQRYEGAREGCVERICAGKLRQMVLLQMKRELEGRGVFELYIQEHIQAQTEEMQALINQRKALTRECTRWKWEHLEEYQRYAEGITKTFDSGQERISMYEKEIMTLNEEIQRRAVYDNTFREGIWDSRILPDMVKRYIGKIRVFREGDIAVDFKLPLSSDKISIHITGEGIDYQNPLFRNADGTTRIKAIWDQSIQSGMPPENISYGTEYTEEVINRALALENPLDLVPSTDTNGHGTFVSGIIAGGQDEQQGFVGAAPMAELLVVKLKPAKEYLKDFYFIDREEAYQETDIMMAIYYLRRQALKRNQSISIYIGLGTNSGEHAGRGALNQYMNRINDSVGAVVSIPVGNEGNARHHYSGVVSQTEEYQSVEVNVGANESGFIMELWGEAPNTYAIGLESPYGEVITQIPPRFQSVQRLTFFLERTVVEAAYVLVEELSGKQLIFLRIREPTEGVWRFRVYGTGNVQNAFNLWMPIRGFVSDNTYFLNPDPDVTLTEPATAEGPICSTAYNHITNSLYFEAGRGYTSEGGIKPDLAAPGVDVYGPNILTVPGQPYGYVRRSGTSIAAAHTAGAAALLMEWAESRSYINRMNGTQVKRYLIRGAERRGNLSYPNPLWGFGTLNLYGTFESLLQRDII